MLNSLNTQNQQSNDWDATQYSGVHNTQFKCFRGHKVQTHAVTLIPCTNGDQRRTSFHDHQLRSDEPHINYLL